MPTYEAVYFDAVTPEPDAARVRLDVIQSDPPATFYRTDTNGTRPVRLSTLPAGAASTVYDYEAALTGPITYDASLTVGAEEYVDEGHTVTLDGATGPRIHAAVAPDLSIAPRMMTPRYTAPRDTGATVHWPINRPDAVIVSGPPRTRQGTLELWAATYEEAATIARVVHDADGTMMLRQTDHRGMDMYFVALRTGIDPAGSEPAAAGWRFLVTVDYAETGFPTAPLRAPRTFQDVLDENTSFRDLRTSGADFRAVYAGVTS